MNQSADQVNETQNSNETDSTVRDLEALFAEVDQSQNSTMVKLSNDVQVDMPMDTNNNNDNPQDDEPHNPRNSTSVKMSVWIDLKDLFLGFLVMITLLVIIYFMFCAKKQYY